MPIDIGSEWKHSEGMVAVVTATSESWVELQNSGRWPLDDFVAQWSIVKNAPGVHTALADRFADGYAAGAQAIRDRVAAILADGIIPLTSERIAAIERQLNEV